MPETRPPTTTTTTTITTTTMTTTTLQSAALTEILRRGGPILGTLNELYNINININNINTNTNNINNSNNSDIDCGVAVKGNEDKDNINKPSPSPSPILSDWMAHIPDETPIVRMNLPGTHDTCTWNYTPEVQESLKRYTGPIPDSKIYRCQHRSIFRMLNDGIRVLDLRYAWNPDLESIGFYHSKALLSPTTQLQDVLFGLYTWLDLHRTETILVSMNYEPGTVTGTISWSDDARLQAALYDILMGGIARRYWVRSNGSLGTLGEARGKLILIQRFDFTLLPEHMTERIGIHLDPGHWIVNGKNTALEYGAGKVAYIQDYYKIDPSSDSHPSSCITDKLHTVLAHLERAIDPALHPDQLYISFASASFRAEEPSLTPQVYALGDGDGKDIVGVNQRLLSWLHEHQGRRFGIVLLDFYDGVPSLVEAIIGLGQTSDT